MGSWVGAKRGLTRVDRSLPSTSAIVSAHPENLPNRRRLSNVRNEKFSTQSLGATSQLVAMHPSFKKESLTSELPALYSPSDPWENQDSVANSRRVEATVIRALSNLLLCELIDDFAAAFAFFATISMPKTSRTVSNQSSRKSSRVVIVSCCSDVHNVLVISTPFAVGGLVCWVFYTVLLFPQHFPCVW